MSSEDSSSSPSGTRIGQILEQARKEQGLSLQQVEQATKIRAKYLKELERGNFSVLPAVYVRGSLRTYADHLRLDGEALTRELKYQQASPDEQLAPMYSEPSKSDFGRSLVSANSPPAGAEGPTMIEDKEDDRPPLIPVGNRFYLYLGSGALVVLILGAVALALVLIGNDQLTASKEAREPMASPATPTDDGAGEDANHSVRHVGDERSADDEGDGRLLREQAGLPPDRGAEDDGGAGRVGQTEQEQSGPSQTGDSRDATTTSSAPMTIEVAPATTEPNATPTRLPAAPTTVESASASTKPNATPVLSTPTTAESPPTTTKVVTRDRQDGVGGGRDKDGGPVGRDKDGGPVGRDKDDGPVGRDNKVLRGMQPTEDDLDPDR